MPAPALCPRPKAVSRLLQRGPGALSWRPAFLPWTRAKSCGGPSEPILIPKLRIEFADFPDNYIILGSRGCSPWRPDADIGTGVIQANWLPLPSRAFPGLLQCSGRCGRAALSGVPTPLSALCASRGEHPRNEKRESSAKTASAAQDWRELPRGRPYDTQRKNINSLPFRPPRTLIRTATSSRLTPKGLRPPRVEHGRLPTGGSGPADPGTNAVVPEPYSTSEFKDLA